MFRDIFSTYTYTGMCNVNLKNFKKHILDTRKKNKEGRKVSNEGGWQSQLFHEPNKYNKVVFETLNEAAFEIKKTLDLKRNIELSGYWYNINGKASFNMPHTHSGNYTVISGVMYIKAPKDSGKIVFQKLDAVSGMMYDYGRVTDFNKYTSSNFEVVPKEQLFVLFPASLYHYVQPNKTNNERISMSFNYNYEL